MADVPVTTPTNEPIDLLDAVDQMTLSEGIAKKTGRPYKFIQIVFANGYDKRIYLDQAELFMVEALAAQSK